MGRKNQIKQTNYILILLNSPKARLINFIWNNHLCKILYVQFTVLPAKSDSDVMFCLQMYQGLKVDGSLVY